MQTYVVEPSPAFTGQFTSSYPTSGALFNPNTLPSPYPLSTIELNQSSLFTLPVCASVSGSTHPLPTCAQNLAHPHPGPSATSSSTTTASLLSSGDCFNETAASPSTSSFFNASSPVVTLEQDGTAPRQIVGGSKRLRDGEETEEGVDRKTLRFNSSAPTLSEHELNIASVPAAATSEQPAVSTTPPLSYD